MMKFRAFVKDERTAECRWFLYTERSVGGAVFACRFGSRDQANVVASAMNRAWEREGRKMTPADFRDKANAA